MFRIIAKFALFMGLFMGLGFFIIWSDIFFHNTEDKYI